jgi:hypothetical protein
MKVKLYYNLSFEFDYRVLSGRLIENKNNLRKQNTRRSRTTPCPRDVDIRMAHVGRERENTPIKQHQVKA